MSTPAKRRLVRDFRRLQQDPPAGITGCPMEDDLMQWQAVIFGPDDTPWEGGTFKLQMNFDEDYPNKPPKVKFLTKIFHPNVYANGQICLDILQSQWSPIYDVAAVLTSIQSLLSDPNPSSPANVEAAKLYTENRREYERKVSEYVQSSWELDAQEIDKLNKEKLEGGGGGNISSDNASSSNNNLSSTTTNNNDSSIPSSTNPPSSSPST